MALRAMILAGLALAAAPATAQMPAVPPATSPACGAADEDLPAGFAAWKARTDLAAAATRAALGGTAIAPGAAYRLTLPRTSSVRYVRQPEKPGGSVSYGGMLSLEIARAGTYVVALGSGAWIDMLRGHEAIVSTAHGHGPACSTIHKMVEFPLTPGRYTIQIAANGTPDIALLVALKP